MTTDKKQLQRYLRHFCSLHGDVFSAGPSSLQSFHREREGDWCRFLLVFSLLLHTSRCTSTQTTQCILRQQLWKSKWSLFEFVSRWSLGIPLDKKRRKFPRLNNFFKSQLTADISRTSDKSWEISTFSIIWFYLHIQWIFLQVQLMLVIKLLFRALCWLILSKG